MREAAKTFITAFLWLLESYCISGRIIVKLSMF